MRVLVRRLLALAAAALVLSLLTLPAADAAAPAWSHRDVRVCGTPASGAAACRSIARVLYANGKAYRASSRHDLDRIARPAASVSYSAVGIRTAYGITAQGDPSRVVAIVDAYDDVDANGVRSGETAWSGAGSACSTYNAAPSWQAIPGSPCGSMKASADLSADADPYSGLQIYTTYSGITGWWIFGGTSLSSPLVASLYTMQGGYGGATLAGQYAWAATTPYYDVTSGSNGTCSPAVVCNAGTGWDGPTGRGSIAVAAVSQTLTSIAVSPTSASVVVGGTRQFSATALDQNGVAMASQPPFSWAVNGGGSISGSGLFTAQAAGGPFTVTATGGGVSGTASVTVTAPVPDFSVAVSPSSQSVRRGSIATYTVTIGRLNGFAGSVTLSLTGAPSGSTVTFSPNPATGTSATLTITTSSATSRRTYTLTVKGVSGSLSHTATATLTVTR